MEENILNKDKFGTFFIIFISIFSILVSIFNFILFILKIYNAAINNLEITIVDFILDDYSFIGIIFSFLQIISSIKLLISGIKKNNIKMFGQTALLCYSITLPLFSNIVINITFEIMKGSYMVIFDYIKPIILMVLLFVLSCFIRRNVLKKKYITLTLIQFSMSIVSLLYFILNWKLCIDSIGDSIFNNIVYY